MSEERQHVIQGALSTYFDGVALEPTVGRLAELAKFIDNHLAPEPPVSPIVVDHLTARVARLEGRLSLEPKVTFCERCGDPMADVLGWAANGWLWRCPKCAALAS